MFDFPDWLSKKGFNKSQAKNGKKLLKQLRISSCDIVSTFEWANEKLRCHIFLKPNSSVLIVTTSLFSDDIDLTHIKTPKDQDTAQAIIDLFGLEM